jgi:very-short-patch-repair endonuclease
VGVVTSDDKAPSWSQRSGREAQREHRGANTRARRLRREPTPAEVELWKALRALNREGFHFRRQPAIGPWVFDFGELSRRLLIEVDGAVHQRLSDVAARDAEKTRWAMANGFRLERFSNAAVLAEMDAVIPSIRALVADPHPQPPPHKGEGRPVE